MLASAFWIKDSTRCSEKHILKSKCTKHCMLGPLFEVAMWEIARRCGEKHICKSKCRKHLRGGPLFEVAMLQNCTPLWREAHFKVKMWKKTDGLGPLFDVQMSKNCTPLSVAYWLQSIFWPSQTLIWEVDLTINILILNNIFSWKILIGYWLKFWLEILIGYWLKILIGYWLALDCSHLNSSSNSSQEWYLIMKSAIYGSQARFGMTILHMETYTYGPI